jgi:phenylpropionate dioxygenase-like ring-hydroxylating dioxygenase large terminal subunit
MNAPAPRPVEPLATAVPRALPAWAYNHPEMTRLEYERLLKPSWQIVCHLSALALPGDFVALDLGADSVVAVRTAQGEIRAFHNVCRHRGARLLEGAGHCPGAITCPYHGWSYRLSGELLAMTARETFPALERSQLGLKTVRVQVIFGLVFVCLAGDPPPLAEIWAGVAEEFAPHRFAEMQPLGSMYLEHWDCDWKIAMDNYLESYHVPIGHPGLHRMFTPDYEDQLNLPTGVARGISWLRERPSPRWSERLYQSLVGQVSAQLPEPHRRRWAFYSMLPNLGIDVFPDQMDFFQVLPRGPGKCAIRGASFALPDERREMRIVRYLAARINRQVQREDQFLCQRVQQGLASGSYEPGPLSRLENCMLEFHDLLHEQIPEARLPDAPARFA